MIRKVEDKFVLLSRDGKKVLGEFASKFQAEEREKQILKIKRAKALKEVGFDSEERP